MKPIRFSSPENAPRQEGEKMRRRIVVVFVLALMLLALGAAPAFARVDTVSQTRCAATIADEPAGASFASANAPGGVIPTAASDGKSQSKGGAAGASGTNC